MNIQITRDIVDEPFYIFAIIKALYKVGDPMFTVLIVEDDAKIASLLEKHLQHYGYRVFSVHNFSQVIEEFKRVTPHLVLLDVNLPLYDGYYWCRQIRTISQLPILFISARNGKMDQVMALDNGADDFITKPFDYDIVLAKINSQIRRVYGEYANNMDERKVSYLGLTLWPERMELSWNEQSVKLSYKEAVLMEILITHCPKIVSRDAILEKLWDEKFVDDNVLSVNVSRVRQRLSSLGLSDSLETIRGSGYRLNGEWDSEKDI